ncbi:MAG: transketolase C-terminal domain-containing protein [Saprospiraceae bacterium]
MSIITYGMGVHWALKTVEKLGIDAEVIDLRTLVPMDVHTIHETVEKTGKVLVLHEDTLFGGIGGEIAAFISEHLFKHLDAPVIRVASLDTPVPFAIPLEKNFWRKADWKRNLNFYKHINLSKRKNTKMDIEKYVSVSGLPGLYRIVSNRSNGLVIEDLDSGKAKFASVRQYQFNPIASIGIYVDGEKKQLHCLMYFLLCCRTLRPIHPEPNASKDALMEYFERFCLHYDRERVYPSDVKRLIKWFTFLNERNLLSLEDENKSEEAAEEEE